MLGACCTEWAGNRGIYEISYNPANIPAVRFNLHDLTRHFAPVARPFQDLVELNTFLGYSEYFARQWKVSLSKQLPDYIEVVNFEPYEIEEEEENFTALPTGAAPLTTVVSGPVAASQPYRTDIYKVPCRGGLVCVRRLSSSLFDPPDDAIQGWLECLAAGPDFRRALPSNWKAVN